MKSIRIDRSSEKPLYAQIRDALRQDVDKGRLKPGDRLPTVAAFAKELGVTQSTIRRALEDLSKAGLTQCHVGRGTFIAEPDAASPAGGDPERTPRPSIPTADRGKDPAFAMAARQLRMGIAKSLEALLPLSRRPGLIQFTSGVPDPSLTREGVLRELADQTMAAGDLPFHAYGDPMGLAPLREALAARFSGAGWRISADQILITAGSQQGISLMAQYALENRHRIVCESPLYIGIANAFGAVGHWVESVARDAAGPLPDRLKRLAGESPCMVYTCPDLHNPMGTDMTTERRAFLTRWIRDHGGILIADEIFRELHFSAEPLPSFMGDVESNHTVVVGSLSKSFMTGLRIGWLVSSRERVRSLLTLKRAMDLGCPSLMQGIALQLITSGTYDEHLKRARAHYRKRRDTALKALAQYMPDGVKWTEPQGGFHMWLELPEGYSSIALFLAAVERGVAIIPGPYGDVDHRFVNGLRFGYGSVTPEQIVEGVQLLADAVESVLQGPPGEPGLSGLGGLF